MSPTALLTVRKGYPATPKETLRPTCNLCEGRRDQQDLCTHAPSQSLVDFREPQVIADSQA